jgi:hypothetical protein
MTDYVECARQNEQLPHLMPQFFPKFYRQR